MKIQFLELAQNELDDAFEYYEYQQEDLGYRFVQEVYNSIELIRSYPLGWSYVSKNSRRCLVKTFPYGIIYQKREDFILVVAVANLHRKPNYWVKRV
jgi:plasmid stabilization system protein ParE